jgi:hypothetical protein
MELELEDLRRPRHLNYRKGKICFFSLFGGFTMSGLTRPITFHTGPPAMEDVSRTLR